jgi:hypothetical protein
VHELRHRAKFVFESHEQLRVVDAQRLQRHDRVQIAIGGLVHDAHAAAAHHTLDDEATIQQGVARNEDARLDLIAEPGNFAQQRRERCRVVGFKRGIGPDACSLDHHGSPISERRKARSR